jgi:catechol 2,3-dioxygenase-like lactoylglutathione lyase family enzyme
MQIHYLEIVTPDVDASVALYSKIYGVSFAAPDGNLGGARTAKLVNGGILSSFLRVTMAFFQCGARPAKGVRLRRALPRTLRVLTLSTLTLKSSCTAWRISVLLARRIGHHGVLIVFLRLPGALFGHANGFDDFKRVHVIPCSAVARCFRTRRG